MYISVYEKDNIFYYVLNVLTLKKTWEKRFINRKVYDALVSVGIKVYDEKKQAKNN